MTGKVNFQSCTPRFNSQLWKRHRERQNRQSKSNIGNFNVVRSLFCHYFHLISPLGSFTLDAVRCVIRRRPPFPQRQEISYLFGSTTVCHNCLTTTLPTTQHYQQHNTTNNNNTTNNKNSTNKITSNNNATCRSVKCSYSEWAFWLNQVETI